MLIPLGYPRSTLLVRPGSATCGRRRRRGFGWETPTSIRCGILPTGEEQTVTLMPSRASSAAGAMAVVAALCYLAAVVIALPLGVAGVVKEEYCEIPWPPPISSFSP